MNPKILPGSESQRQIYDELTDFYALGQKALIFQAQALGIEPVKSTPWSWAQSISLDSVNQLFFTQLQDDFNFTGPGFVVPSMIYFGIVTASFKVTSTFTGAGNFGFLALQLNPFSKIANSIFNTATITVLSITQNSPDGSLFIYQSSQPIMFNYLRAQVVSLTAGQVFLDISFYGQQISI